MKTLNLIGGGRVGKTLGRLFQSAGVYQVQGVLTRSAASAQQTVDFIGAGQASHDLASLAPADVWMLAVPDAKIEAVAAMLARRGPPPGPALAFHCSGALGASELQTLRDQGWQVASAHCLLSFATPERALRQFAGTPCALEGDAAALAELEAAFSAIGAQCFRLSAEHKMLYHAGAVVATNFLPVLQDLAERLWRHSGMPAELAQQLRRSLLQNAVDNIIALGPQAALTGPAARGDAALVERQGEAVAQWQAEAGDAYRALSTLAAQLAKKIPTLQATFVE